ncbi:expressed unknown protein [Seminavis robusta]|uniref:Uncharacterized protein n=1 Tax=Seminavis robusta TaxID=568900 RepID=A0A9N8EA99_9STRA|nr:expressed unknown protein [Seminavis robusta]|eukprot:Sro833_g208580.1 n/a (532) ;mRNA; f:34620-36215
MAQEAFHDEEEDPITVEEEEGKLKAEELVPLSANGSASNGTTPRSVIPLEIEGCTDAGSEARVSLSKCAKVALFSVGVISLAVPLAVALLYYRNSEQEVPLAINAPSQQDAIASAERLPEVVKGAKEEDVVGWVPNPHDFALCRANNTVLARETSTEYVSEDAQAQVMHQLPTPWQRAWSLRPQDFEPKHGGQNCSSVDELLQAIQLGHRTFDDEHDDMLYYYDNATLDTWIKREKTASTFVPYGCDIPVLSSEEICEILNMFNSIIVIGDSLVRHVQAGLLVGLTNNFVSGSLLGSDSQDALENCRCDGLLSEHILCRTHLGSNFSELQPFQACPNLRTSDRVARRSIFQERFTWISNHHTLATHMDSAWFDHCWEVDQNGDPVPFLSDGKQNKGMLLLFEGGLHHHLDPQSFIKQILAQFFNEQHVRLCSEAHKLYVIWQRIGSQSPLYDSLFPFQAQDRAKYFNDEVDEWIYHVSNHTIIQMDTVNMTRGAQKSDGAHFLLNVNFFKAQYLLQIAKKMKEEDRFVILN